MYKFLLLISIALRATSISAQNKTGFINGDKAFVRYLEKNLGNLSHSKDTTSYYFTIALLIFNNQGKIKAVKYGAQENLIINSFISEVLMQTNAMWNPKLTKNKNLMIPIELIKPDFEATWNKKLITYDLFKHFTDAFDVTVVRPILILRFDPNYRKV